jgi:hypothetical protein
MAKKCSDAFTKNKCPAPADKMAFTERDVTGTWDYGPKEN